MQKRTTTINRYQGNKLLPGNLPTSVPDTQVNSTSTTLRLPGRSVPDYGKMIIENFVWLLEHFAGPNPPSNPTTGQIWFETQGNPGSGILKVYDGCEWEDISLARTGNRFPDTPNNGEVFYNTMDESISIYVDGLGWKTIRNERIFSQPIMPSPVNAKSGDLWYDTQNKELAVFDGEANAFINVGPYPFPRSLAGQAGKFLNVNDAETAVTFSDIPRKSFFDLTDTPKKRPSQNLQELRYNNATNELEFFTPVDNGKNTFVELEDTPTNYGENGQILISYNNKLEWINEKSRVLDLTDTPGNYGLPGQVLTSSGINTFWSNKTELTGSTIIPAHDTVLVRSQSFTNFNPTVNVFTSVVPLILPEGCTHILFHFTFESLTDSYVRYNLVGGENTVELLPLGNVSSWPINPSMTQWRLYQSFSKLLPVDVTNDQAIVRVTIQEATDVTGQVTLSAYATGYVITN